MALNSHALPSKGFFTNSSLLGSGVITLGNDIQYEEGSATYLEARSGGDITLDLAGFTIDRGLSNINLMDLSDDYDDNGTPSIILNQGTLTITDSSDDKSGAIIGDLSKFGYIL